MSFPQLPIKLVVGLGNPGPEYERTRHNAGFWFAEDVAHEIGGSFASEAKFFGQLARGVGGHNEVRVLKPMKYMNLSGQSVAAVAKFFNIAPEQMLVAHDELDLPAGDIKLKFGQLSEQVVGQLNLVFQQKEDPNASMRVYVKYKNQPTFQQFNDYLLP